MVNVTGKAASLDEEQTRFIDDESAQKEQSASTQQSQPEVAQSKKNKRTNPVAAAAGGFVAGAAAGAGATAAASNIDEEAPSLDDVVTDETAELEAPAPEQAILANDEGIRYAHVEADNFNDAFAQARAQVGPGGVFEYNGRLYGTYYAEEWNNMSAQERADYQNRVNEVAPSHHATEAHHIDVVAEEPVAPDAEMISVEPVDNEIHVLGAEAIETPNGNINVVYLESDGTAGAMIDLDGDGSMDVIVIDNGNGVLDDQDHVEAIPDDVDITLNDLEEMYHAQNDDPLYASNDDMPDYINDSDSIMTV